MTTEDTPSWTAEITRARHLRAVPLDALRAVPSMVPIARSVVGYFVMFPDRVATADPELCSDDIVDGEAKEVWSAIVNLREDGEVVDAASIESRLIIRGMAPAAAIAVPHELMLKACASGDLDKHIATIRTATRDRAELEARRRAAALAPLAWQIGERPLEPVTVYSTPFPELDAKIGGGISTRSTTIVVSRTGAGKSGLVLDIGVHILRVHDVPYLYCSSELDDDECFARLGAKLLNVAHRDVYFGRVRREEATEALRGLKLHVLDRRALRVSPLKVISDHVKRLSDHYGIAPATCVDFLQDLLADKDEKSIRMGVSTMAGELRDMGSDLDAVMLLVASTGRAFYKPPKEGADDPISYLGSAKESGDVEYAATNLLFLDVATEHSAGLHAARIVVAKARRGTTGFVGAMFDGPTGRWQPSADSVAALEVANRSQAGAFEQRAKEDARVLAKIAKCPMRTWNTLRDSCGMGKIAADRAKNRLLEANQIESVEETFKDGAGRKARRMVLRVMGAPELPLTGPQSGSEGGSS